MKSSIKIDFLDRGNGAGLEPVIKVDIIHTDDPRDKLIQTLFQSCNNYLQINYINNRELMSGCGPVIDKTLILFKPDKKIVE